MPSKHASKALHATRDQWMAAVVDARPTDVPAEHRAFVWLRLPFEARPRLHVADVRRLAATTQA